MGKALGARSEVSGCSFSDISGVQNLTLPLKLAMLMSKYCGASQSVPVLIGSRICACAWALVCVFVHAREHFSTCGQTYLEHVGGVCAHVCKFALVSVHVTMYLSEY